MLKRITTILAVLALAISATAQIVAPKEEKQSLLRSVPRTVTDDEGLLQWKEHEPSRCLTCHGKKEAECGFCQGLAPENCPECDGDQKSPCRECAGTGETYDPLEWMVCMGCLGGGYIHCRMCNAKGTFPISNDGGRESKCKGCKTERGIACQTCRGKQKIKALRPGKKLAEASLEQLTEAKEAIAEARTNMVGFSGDDQVGKAVKMYEDALKPVRRMLPVKEMAKTLKEMMKTNDRSGAAFHGHSHRQHTEIDAFAKKTVLMLDYSMELLDVALARAEANAATEAEKRDKK